MCRAAANGGLKTRKIWEAKVFRLILLAFVSVILPIYVLGYFFYYRGYDGIKQDITSTLLSQTVRAVDSLTIDVQTISDLLHDLLTDMSLPLVAHRYPLMSQYEWFAVVNHFRQKLTAIQLRSPIIEDASLFIVPEMIEISAITGFERLAGDAVRNLDLPGSRSATGFHFTDDGLSLTLAPVTILDSTFLVSARISGEALRKQLSLSATYPDSSLEIVTTDGNFLSGSTLLSEERGAELLASVSAGPEEDVLEFIWNAERCFVAYAKSPYLNLSFWNYIPVRTMLRPVFVYRILLGVFTLIGIVAIIAFSIVIYLLIEKPLMKIVGAFRRLEGGDLDNRIHHNRGDEFSYLYEAFNQMVAKLKKHIGTEYEYKMLFKDAQLNRLQIQINPHFLYNCFFILMGLQNDERYDEATRMLQMLSRYYRHLSQTGSAEVNLEEEIDLARAYCDIQLVRFSSRIAVTFSEPPSRFRMTKVPLMTLQPLIENAFSHGLKHTESDGRINIDFHDDEESLQLIVEDNGGDTDDDRIRALRKLLLNSAGQGPTHGLVNVHRRIVLKFGTEGLTVSRSALGGLKVVVHVRTNNHA